MPPNPTAMLASRLGRLLSDGRRPLIVLTGAGTSVPFVPAVSGLTVAAQEFVERCASVRSNAEIDDILAPEPGAQDVSHSLSSAYGEAMRAVQRVRGQDGIQTFVQWASLQAYRDRPPEDKVPDATPLTSEEFEGYESASDAWSLPAGLQALANVTAQYTEQFGDYFLTTNFDPLLEIAMRRSGVKAETIGADVDSEPSGQRVRHGEKIVVHLHGDCYGRTLHAPWELQQPRTRLEEWLGEYIRGSSLLVIGYSGWDDIVQRVIRDHLGAHRPKIELMWSVYGDEADHRLSNPQLEQFFADHQSYVTPYYGVDRDTLFTSLEDSVGGSNSTQPLGGSTSAAARSDCYSLSMRLKKEFRFGVIGLKASSAPKVVFWPHQLREPHLIHGVHALAAMLLSKVGMAVELLLDDTGMQSDHADRAVDEFSESVAGWFRACGLSETPHVTRMSSLLEAHPESLSRAQLWNIACELYSPANSAFDALGAAKVATGHEPFSARSAEASRVLRPVYIWYALDRLLERYDLLGSGDLGVVTLGGEDEQGMWELWDKRRRVTPVAHFYLPRLRLRTQGADIWNIRDLWKATPYGASDLEQFIFLRTQGGNEDEGVLEWLFTTGCQLASFASDGAKGTVAIDNNEVANWGDALMMLRERPQVAAQLISEAVYTWFHV